MYNNNKYIGEIEVIKGTNFTRAKISNGISYLTIWNSYKTLIAFEVLGQDIILSENLWGSTTGRHLNLISRVSTRVPRKEFLELYQKALTQFALDILQAYPSLK